MAGSENEDVDMKDEGQGKMAQQVPALVTHNNFNVLLNMAMNETTSTFKSSPQNVPKKNCNFETHSLLFQSFTWHREKHSLFDTEAKDDKLSKISETIKAAS